MVLKKFNYVFHVKSGGMTYTSTNDMFAILSTFSAFDLLLFVSLKQAFYHFAKFFM